MLRQLHGLGLCGGQEGAGGVEGESKEAGSCYTDSVPLGNRASKGLYSKP